MNVIALHTTESSLDGWWLLFGVLTVAVLLAAYGKGVQDLWERRGQGAIISMPRATAFAAGAAAVLVALSPPVDRFAESSFAGHMTQHMILMTVAAPLLAFGGAGLPWTMALPRGGRRFVAKVRSTALARWLRRPLHLALTAAGLHTVVLWGWHLPAPYLAAERSPTVHALEHASFLAAAWLMWSIVLAPGHRRPPGPVRMLVLFIAGLTGTALGATLTLAPAPVYPAAVLSAANPLADQQLAGLVMWIPMDLIVLSAVVSIFSRWLNGLDSSTPGHRETSPRPPPIEEVHQ